MQKLSAILVIIISIGLVTVMAFQVTYTRAQEDYCFAETGYCINGRFRTYWEQNGGLPVFGYPVSPAQYEVNPTDGQSYLTQWFERNRFELHPENEPPYDVLLGLLGVSLYEQQGQQDPTTYHASDLDAPHYFAQTGHAIAPVFVSYWQSHGLELGEEGMSQRESLALFGYPISAIRDEVNAADGKVYATQWFERARFEYHPESSNQVQLGLLGNEMTSAQVQPEQRSRPTNTPTWTPTATRTPWVLQNFLLVTPIKESSSSSSGGGNSWIIDPDPSEHPTDLPTPTETNTPPPEPSSPGDDLPSPTPTQTSTPTMVLQVVSTTFPTVQAIPITTPSVQPVLPTVTKVVTTVTPTHTSLPTTATPTMTGTEEIETTLPTTTPIETATSKPSPTVGMTTATPKDVSTTEPVAKPTNTPVETATATDVATNTPTNTPVDTATATVKPKDDDAISIVTLTPTDISVATETATATRTHTSTATPEPTKTKTTTSEGR